MDRKLWDKQRQGKPEDIQGLTMGKSIHVLTCTKERVLSTLSALTARVW